MAKPKAFDPTTLKLKREQSRINQIDFWSRFGVSQSGGSRYESGRTIPAPTAMLMWLHEAGRITDADLADAKKAIKPKR